MVARPARHRRQRLQIRKEIAQVLDVGMLIGSEGKRRKIMAARGRSALRHRGDEIGFAPAPDAVGSVGRDIGNVKRPEWRWDRKAAAELQPIGLVGHGMAGGTSAGVERCETVGRIRRVGGQRTGSNHRRDRQPPIDRKADGGENDKPRENSSENSPQHSPIRHRSRLSLMSSMTVFPASSCLIIARRPGPPRE